MFLSFCDLDLTLIQTERHLDSDELRDVVYTSPSGRNICVTPKQKALYTLLNSQEHYVIPVTARSLESLKRTEPTFEYHSFKVCNHGIFIYDHMDKLIPEFTESLISKVSRAQNTLKETIKYLHKHNVNSKLISFKTYAYYIEGTFNTANTSERLLLNAIVKRHRDMTIYVNGSSFALFPNALKPKSDAVRYLKKRSLQQRPDLVTIGIGDSTSDLFFMQECDYLMIPVKDNVQIIKECLT